MAVRRFQRSASTPARGETELIAQVDLGKEKFQVPGRWSGVLEKQGGKWVIALSHFSYIEQDEKEEK